MPIYPPRCPQAAIDLDNFCWKFQVVVLNEKKIVLPKAV